VEATGRSVLRSAIHGQRRFVAGAAALAAGHQGCEALVPVIIGVVIDTAVSSGSLPRLLTWLGILAVIFLVLSLAYRFAERNAQRAGEQAAHELRLKLTRRVLDPHGGADGLPGALVNIATGDVKRVGDMVAAVPYAFAALTALTVSSVVLLTSSIPLGLLILLGTPPVLWLTHLAGRPLERRSHHEQERAAEASGVAADLVAGLRVLKGIGAERAAVQRYRRTSRRSLNAAVRAARAHGLHNGAVMAVTGVFLALIALIGAHLALAGSITVGELVAAVGLAQFLPTPFHMITYVSSEHARARASAERVAEVLEAGPAVTPGAARLPAEPVGELHFAGVSHGPLRAVELRVEPGELLGVACDDPAAAKALLELVCRDADPEQGRVMVDGVPIAGLALSELRRAVLVAEHDADLFEVSVLDNVVVDAARSDAASRAIQAATVDLVAETLPDGLHTVLAERGSSLSGGQRQRVALARALAADPPVLVLHDPTTAVDPVTEAAIASGIAELRKSRTTVVVTTSPSLLAAADRVVFVRDGTIAGSGSHSDLASDPDYRAVVFS